MAIRPRNFIQADPYFDSVSLLCPFNGTDGDTTSSDLSTIGHTLTFNGNSALDGDIRKFGFTSLGLDGASDYVSVPDHISFSPESGSFTIEFHVRFAVDPGTGLAAMVTKWDNPADGVNKEWTVRLNNNLLGLVVSANGTSPIIFADVAWNPSVDTWYHIACVLDRELATDETRFYVDGIQVGASDTTANATATIFQGATNVWIGGYGGGTNDWVNGNIANVRITKGVARYTANFTPPQQSYPTTTNATSSGITKSRPRNVQKADPDFSSVVLLAPFSGEDGDTTSTDLSNSAHTLTFAGNADLDGINRKYGFTSAYFPATGSNSYVDTNSTADLALGTGDFTIELWVMFETITLGTWQGLLDQRANGVPTSVHPAIYLSSTDNLNYYVNGDVRITGPTKASLNTFQWYHVAVCRASGTTKLFVDGVQSGSDYTDSNNYLQERVRIGGLGNDTGYPAKGWIENVRVTKGVARYTTTFTPPDRAFPTTEAVGTQPVVTDGLVLYLDAGNTNSYPGSGNTWTDLSGNGLNATTVGPTFIDGGVGGAFDFESSNINWTINDDPLLNLGGTNTDRRFTVAVWVESTNLISDTYIFSKLSNELSMLMGYQDNNVNMFINSSYRPAASTTQMSISSGTWTHFVYTKGPNAESDNWKGYKNGVEQFTATQSFGFDDTALDFVIGSAGGGNWYEGRLTILQLYDRALTPAEVQQNFDADKARFGL